MDKPNYEELRLRMLITGCTEGEIIEACRREAVRVSDRAYLEGLAVGGLIQEEEFSLGREDVGGSGCKEVEVLREVVTDWRKKHKVVPRKLVCSFSCWEAVMGYLERTYGDT